MIEPWVAVLLFCAGAGVLLVGVVAGFVLGKPYLDRYQNLRLAAKKAQAKPAPTPTAQGGTPTI